MPLIASRAAVEPRMPALQPAADASSVVREWVGKLPTDRRNPEVAAAQNARVRSNLWLTTAQWPGPVERATAIVHHLVRNAVRHGSAGSDQVVELRLAITQPGALLIEVADSLSQFAGFDAATCSRGGLHKAQRLGAVLAWFPTPTGKTVQARIPAPTVQS
ncbi:hypothetical protein ABT001_32800 [Streptomyces sp. NPDC002793]|uniref:hypothetical protein n=1 Tax=Streptomyces sp. NPDC002793 TaxID=3154432 RepID=UPI00332616C4